jgi:hypothetical protein
MARAISASAVLSRSPVGALAAVDDCSAIQHESTSNMRLNTVCPSSHFRFQHDDAAIHDEAAVSAMMYGPGLPLTRFDPRLDHLEHEQIKSADKARIDHLAFKVCEAIGDQGCRD